MTEQVEREHGLQRQNERLEEFASIVSHDLRNPLRVADGRLERIVKQIADAHGWEITVGESEQGGARFEVTGVESADH